MSENIKLFKCYKGSCNKCIDSENPYFTEDEYNALKNPDNKINCPEGHMECEIKELKPEDYPIPPPKGINIKLIASISAVVVLIVAIVFFIKRSNSTENEKVVETKKVKEQPKIKPEKKNTQPTPEAEPTPEPEPEPEKLVNQEPVKKQSSTAKNNVPNGMQTLSIGGNTYKGEVLNGKPHGMGTMYYRKSTQISPKDLKNRMAESGDYLTGEFYQGYVVQGKLFDSNNNVKEVVMIGR
jgi:hypothetical protein